MDFCRFFLILILFLNRLEVEMIFRNFAMCVFFGSRLVSIISKFQGKQFSPGLLKLKGKGEFLYLEHAI